MALIDDLINNGYLFTPEIINAFQKVKRNDFVLEKDIPFSENNIPLPIGYNQTISQPLTVAFMMEKLSPQTGEKILNIGSGSGWTVALLSEIVGNTGWVYGMERVKELFEFGKSNILKYEYIKNGIANLVLDNGYKGLPNFAPFDKIMVDAAAPEVPAELLKQLRIGGRLVMPIGPQNGIQDIVVIDKITFDKFREERFPGFVFVPLVK